MTQKLLNLNNTDRLTTTTSTMTTRPITSAAPSPVLKPKRKYSSVNEDLESIISKKPRISYTQVHQDTPISPLYKNFGNGLSVCNNTKTRFANINEVLQYLSYDEQTVTNTKSAITNCYINDINDKTLCEDVLNKFIDDLHDTKELPELNLNLWDLRDMFKVDLL